MKLKFIKATLVGLVLSISGFTNAAIIIDVSDNGGFAEFNISGNDTAATGGSISNGFWLNDLLETGAIDNTVGYLGRTFFTGSAMFSINSDNHQISDIWFNGTAYDFEMGFRFIGSLSATAGDTLGFSGSLVSTGLSYSLFNVGSYSLDSVGPFSGNEVLLTDGITFNVGQQVVSEPATVVLLALGAFGLVARRFKK